MKILGIDPGTNILGYCILEIKEKKPYVVNSGVLKMNKEKNPYEKLRIILETTRELIEEYKPETLSIEAPFYSKNIQSMHKLGRAQGVAIAVAISQGLDIQEYSPREIKQSVTGNGNASKNQIAAMVKSILNLRQMPETFDETDAIAVALCHFYRQNKISTKKSYSSWNDFISKNPDKLK